MNAILLSNRSEERVRKVYTTEHVARLSQLVEFHDRVYQKEDVLRDKEQFSQVRYIFSTWGMPEF